MINANSDYHTNKYNAETACVYCEGIFEHEAWCATCDPHVSYAYQIVADASKMTLGDSLILHSLGVSWANSVRGAVI